MIETLCTGSVFGSAWLDQRVAALVVRDDPLLAVGDEPAAPLGPGHHAVDRLLELVHADLVEPAPAGEQRGLVHEVREVGAGEARACAAR